MDASYDQLYHRNIIEIVSESLNDFPLSKRKEDEDDKDYVNYTENNVRYKLIIDNSEDDSVVRHLLTCGLLDQTRTRMVACSDFPEESGMHVS